MVRSRRAQQVDDYKKLKRPETLLPVRQSRSWDVTDDSSSVTSMTSSARTNLCHVCKEPDAPPTINSTFTCARCKKKEIASLAPSMSSSMPPPAHQSAEDPARKCEEPNCTGIPSKHQASGKQLCKRHQITLDHRRSKMKPPVAMKTGSVPKLFSKGKLYNFKPEDKQYLRKDDRQGTKRKRVALAQKSDSSGLHLGNSDKIHLHQNVVDESTHIQILPSRVEFPHPNASGQSMTSLADDEPNSPKELRSSIELRTTNDSMTDNLPRIIDNRISISPEYEPPSAMPLSRTNSPFIPTISEQMVGRGKTSQIPAHFEPMFSSNRLANLGVYKSPYAASDDSAPPSVGQPDKHHIYEDGDMQDIEPPAFNSSNDRATTNAYQDHLQTLSSLHIESLEPHAQSNSPNANARQNGAMDDPESGDDLLPKYPTPWMLDSMKPGYDPENDPNFGYSTRYLPHPQSLEYKRRLRALTYDPTELDNWLAKLRKPKPRFPPSGADLYKTQKWGHIDPRVAWPKKQDPEFLAEKRAEIEARPKRKANFGKVLTEQNIKERLEKGWNIHQNTESRSKEEKEALNQTYEIIYGIRGLVTDYEYKLIGGRESWVEKVEIVDEETGVVRRRKESERRIIPIEG
ncbi:hypothetical protein BGZ60DRAFT_522754 [Tricladium varicosporioides]|nr:hypothetical protein BGZ60DRAFT_522754 [Hymenoscyphus varicosporioides]